MALTQQIQWHEQYASHALNRKFAGIIPQGVYHGFVVTPLTGMSLSIAPDVSEHPLSVAVVERDGYSVTITSDADETFTVPEGTEGEWFLCLSAQYVLSATGTQEFVLVASASLEGYHVVLARLTLPTGTTTITAGMISGTGRANVTLDMPFNAETDRGKILFAGETAKEKFWQHNPNHNFLIDGAFDTWWESTYQVSSGYGSDTMWRNEHGECTKAHYLGEFAVGETFPDGTPAPHYFSRNYVLAASSSASEYCFKFQRIEDVRTLNNKTATLSFYAKADAVKNLTVELVQYFGTGGSPSAFIEGIGTTKIQLSTSWAKYRVTMNIPSISGKTLGTNEDHGLSVVFWFSAGSNFAYRTDTLGYQSGTFDLALVKLEEGEVDTPYLRDVPYEFERTQRYYAAGIVHTVGVTNQDSKWFTLPKTMRVPPTVTATLVGGVSTSYYSTTDIAHSGWRYYTSTPNGAADYSIVADARL